MGLERAHRAGGRGRRGAAHGVHERADRRGDRRVARGAGADRDGRRRRAHRRDQRGRAAGGGAADRRGLVPVRRRSAPDQHRAAVDGPAPRAPAGTAARVVDRSGTGRPRGPERGARRGLHRGLPPSRHGRAVPPRPRPAGQEGSVPGPAGRVRASAGPPRGAAGAARRRRGLLGVRARAVRGRDPAGGSGPAGGRGRRRLLRAPRAPLGGRGPDADGLRHRRGRRDLADSLAPAGRAGAPRRGRRTAAQGADPSERAR